MEAITIRTLTDAADCRALVPLQRAVWNMPDAEIIPVSVMMAAIKSGGLLQGAFVGAEPAGFTLAFAGYAAGQPYLYSHAMGVHPDYRGLRLGIRLKWAQAQAAVERGLGRIAWTYDPLQPVNAHLNLNRLGTTSRTYLTDVYGVLDDALNRGLPTDRLLVEWRLDQPAVAAVLRRLADCTTSGVFPDVGSGPPEGVSALDLDALDATALAAALDAAADGSWACCTLTADIRRLKTSDPQAARRWCLRLRSLLGAALARGWVARWFEPLNQGGRYWLCKAKGDRP